MQLDRTRIAIRQRGSWELLDLALRVMREYLRPLVASTFVLAAPLILLNWFALRWLLADEYSWQTVSRYLWVMLCLVVLQAPLATLATTLYLGHTMFSQPVTARSILKDLHELSGRLCWVHLWRGTWLGVALTIFLTDGVDYSPAEFVLPFVCLFQVLLRAARPFVNEIVLLERSPVWAKDPGVMTVGRRSRSLHLRNGSDLFARWLLAAVACASMAYSLILALWFAIGVITVQWSWGPLVVQIVIPLVMWLVVTFSSVVRFLNYIDLRIRREGWEVELKVRAAANELKGLAA